MSAYMVKREVIKYLITAAGSLEILKNEDTFRWYHNGKWHELRKYETDRATSAGQMLWDANKKSIEARYPDTIGHPDRMPGVVIGENYIYAHSQRLTGIINPLQVIATCNCFDYQACEYEGWEDSEAYAFIEALKEMAIMALPGYDEMEWGAPKETEKVTV